MASHRASWGSKLGFILATSGAAIGLGNIQRFPYIVAQGGGGAFVLLYLLCVLSLGIPLMLLEFAIGRHSQKNPALALSSIKDTFLWRFVGFFCVLTAFAILSYYLVPAGWTLAYTVIQLSGSKVALPDFSAHPYYTILSVACFQLVNIFIVKKGLKAGIEHYSKILLPILFALLIILVIRSLTLPGAMEGLSFYLNPDFSKINSKVFLLALSQAFFSLCIGEAVLITYGSYASKKENLLNSALAISFFDSIVAILSGLIIFPALYSFGLKGNEDIGLIYNVMPRVFSEMPFGQFFGAAFFLLLGFAALTTCIALFEISTSFLCEYKNIQRKKAVWLVGAASFLLSIPIALSKGAHSGLSSLRFNFLGQEMPLYEFCDFFWGNLAMVFNALMLCIFTGWVWGSRSALRELARGCPKLIRYLGLWELYIRYLAPLFILAVLVGLFL